MILSTCLSPDSVLYAVEVITIIHGWSLKM